MEDVMLLERKSFAEVYPAPPTLGINTTRARFQNSSVYPRAKFTLISIFRRAVRLCSPLYILVAFCPIPVWKWYICNLREILHRLLSNISRTLSPISSMKIVLLLFKVWLPGMWESSRHSLKLGVTFFRLWSMNRKTSAKKWQALGVHRKVDWNDQHFPFITSPVSITHSCDREISRTKYRHGECVKSLTSMQALGTG